MHVQWPYGSRFGVKPERPGILAGPTCLWAGWRSLLAWLSMHSGKLHSGMQTFAGLKGGKLHSLLYNAALPLHAGPPTCPPPPPPPPPSPLSPPCLTREVIAAF